jgi:hypothetical protein
MLTTAHDRCPDGTLDSRQAPRSAEEDHGCCPEGPEAYIQRPEQVQSCSGKGTAPSSTATRHIPTPHTHAHAHAHANPGSQKFKDKPLPAAENDALSSHPQLINRAIAMHLLREGQFSVASTFIEEANRNPPRPEPIPGTPSPYTQEAWGRDAMNGAFNSEKLQQQFAEMYHILHQLRQQRNLGPAIDWARDCSRLLEARGSNLEFELCRLKFVCLFVGRGEDGNMTESEDGPLRAWAYARSAFAPFQARYSRDIQKLIGAMAFYSNVQDSPYKRYFYNDSAWEEVAASFTREFCSLLGLSADSPLYIAATAGAIALPTLLKLQNIMKEKRTEWTTQNELPVSYSTWF